MNPSAPYDRLGIGFAGALALWIVTCSVAAGGNPWPPITLLALAGGAYWLGRFLGRTHVLRSAGCVALGIAGLALVSGPDALTGGALAPPLGYGNANGSFYVLGVAAACMVATVVRDVVMRRLSWGLAFLLSLLAVATTSKAAMILTAAILGTALLVNRLGRWVTVVGPAAIAVCLFVTVFVGGADGSSLAPPLVDALSERRATLWQESLEIVADEPVFGTGPGTFAETSPTAMRDRDARWAHSGYLQMAAETGVLGLLLLGALLLWVYGALYRSGQDPRIVVLGTAAVTALAIHASVDYVLHFAAVTAVAAPIAGLASVQRVTPSIRG